jgi:hypothetical protein
MDMEKIIAKRLREYQFRIMWARDKIIMAKKDAIDLSQLIASDIKSKLEIDLDKAIKEGILANARLQTKYEKQLREINNYGT